MQHVMHSRRDRSHSKRAGIHQRILVVAAICALATIHASAITNYVAIHGSDANDGSQATPWRTIQYAVTNVTSSNEVWVGEGTYVENIAVPVTAAIAFTLKGGFNTNTWTWNPTNNPTIIKAANGGLDVIDMRTANNNIIGFTVTGGNQGIYLYNINATPFPHTTVTHCIITNNGSYGIYVYVGKCGLKAANCLIAGNGADGIRSNVDNGAVTYVHNCTIANNSGSGFYNTHTYNAVANLRNCIIANNGAYGVYDIAGSWRDTRLYDTCLYGNTNGNFEGQDVSLHYGMISDDPAFVGSGDYRLQNGSTCVDRGMDLSADGDLPVTDDLAATARSAPFDTGCYQSSYSAATRYAATYVDTANGDDAWAGTNWSTAKATINAGITIADEDGTCHVAAGVYKEEVILSTPGMTLVSTNQALTIITNSASAGVWMLTTNVTLRGFTIEGALTGVELAWGGEATNIVVAQCAIRGNTDGVGTVNGGGVTARYYRFDQCTVASNADDGLSLAGKNGLIARNCLIAENGGDGVEITVDNGNAQYIYNCTIASNAADGINMNHNFAKTINMKNCAITHNGGWAIGSSGGSMSDNISYSCFYANTSGNFERTVNLGIGVLYQDPLYAAGSNYQAQSSSSPLVDNGTDLSGNGVTNDLLGVARSDPFDLGAYQSPYTKPLSYSDMYADAVGGDNSWAGTNWATAKKTIGAALSLTLPTGTCHVASGTYNEELSISLVGQTLEGTNWTTTIVSGSGGTVVSLQATNTTVRNLTIRGGLYGVRVASGSQATNILVDHCIISSNTYGVGIVYTAPVTQERTVINRCVLSNNTSHAISWTVGKDYVDVRNSLIVDNGGHGFYTPQDNSHAHYFSACTIADNALSGLKVDHGRGYNATMTLKNCIFSGNGGYAVERLRTGLGSDVVENTCVYGNTNGAFPGGARLQGYVISANPQYEGSGSYKLANGSPCVGAGQDLSGDGITTDIDGTARTVPYDMGCYESAYSAPAKSADTYVDATTGDDAQAGTSPASAKKTIGAALVITATDGTCHVTSGTYSEQVFLGPAGVTLEGDDYATTIVTSGMSKAIWPGAVPPDTFSSNWYSLVWLQDTNVVLRGFTLAGAENGVLIAGGANDGDLIDQCAIRDNTDGIAEQWSDVDGVRFTVNRCLLSNNDRYGLHLNYDNGFTLINCLIADNGMHGILTSVDNSPWKNTLLYCTIADNATNGYWASHFNDNTTYFTNCLITGNGQYGILQYDATASVPSRDIYVSYSCLSGNDTTNFWSENDKIIIAAANVITNELPTFQDGYIPASGSPCYGSAIDIGITEDIAGQKRPTGGAADMGAYEAPEMGTIFILR